MQSWFNKVRFKIQAQEVLTSVVLTPVHFVHPHRQAMWATQNNLAVNIWR
jgi:hypothetical protein